jgi:hypothetical protein
MNLMRRMTSQWTFTQDDVAQTYIACAYVYCWLMNILNFHSVFQEIPLVKSAAIEAENLFNKMLLNLVMLKHELSLLKLN